LIGGQPPVTLWVKVPKPTFDLVGVVLSSFAFAGFAAILSVALGLLWGIVRLRLPKKERTALGLENQRSTEDP
jgi:ABC-type Fe3+ transport system permease subunit